MNCYLYQWVALGRLRCLLGFIGLASLCFLVFVLNFPQKSSLSHWKFSSEVCRLWHAEVYCRDPLIFFGGMRCSPGHLTQCGPLHVKDIPAPFPPSPGSFSQYNAQVLYIWMPNQGFQELGLRFSTLFLVQMAWLARLVSGDVFAGLRDLGGPKLPPKMRLNGPCMTENHILLAFLDVFDYEHARQCQRATTV